MSTKHEEENTPMDVRVARYNHTRYWAIWINGHLLAVTVYKKGAMAIRDWLLTINSDA